ncbi:Rft-1-domain-containing protein [Xylariomycetidae sp. FL2044]|nr:Rft-1-domain-containing protein [Xylariomycetidae sp. FL2044]
MPAQSTDQNNVFHPTTTTTTSSSSSAVRGASLLIVLQILSRAVTFIANQLLLRFLTAQLLGVSTQLEVYYLSVLFFARESLRVALQRQGGGGGGGGDAQKSDGGSKESDVARLKARRDSQSVVNVAHLSFVLGLGAAVGLGWAYLRYVDAATAGTPYLETALRIYGLAALIELLSEPAFVVLQYRLRLGPRAAAESIATFLRCLTTFGAANWAWRKGLELGVLPFALGQLAYGVGLLGVYAFYGLRLASSEGFSLLPSRAPLRQEKKDKSTTGTSDDGYVLGYFYRPTLNLASSLTAQSFVKHILTQGDTFLVSILSDPGSQGVYALANNYGSLLARLVFQPVEESSRNYFSKLLSSSSTPSSSSSSPPEKREKTPPNTIQTAKTDLQTVLKSYLLLSLLILALGPPAAPLLIQIVAGTRWSASGAGRVLARYCLYIPLLALNGVLEAFVSSVATEAQVHRQSLWMAGFSLAFAAAGFVTLRVLDLGAEGLVWANAVNMLCRIAWSARFIGAWFGARGVDFFGGGSILPKGLGAHVVGAAVLWSALGRAGIEVGAVSAHVFRDLVTVAVMAVPYVVLIAYTERQFLVACYRSIRGRRGSSSASP